MNGPLSHFVTYGWPFWRLGAIQKRKNTKNALVLNLKLTLHCKYLQRNYKFQISDLTWNPKNGLFWPKFFASNPQKKLLIKFLMVQGVYWIFCGQIRAKKFSPFQRSGPLVLNFCQKSKTPPFGTWKIFFVQFGKKWHFWNQLAKPISEMSFFLKSDKKIFEIFPTNTKTRVFDFCQKFKTKGTDLWNGGNFLSSIWPQKIQ